MLINLDELHNKYNLQIKGVLHIGAHECEELDAYLKHISKDKIIWLEANPVLVEKMKQRDPDLRIYQALITDRVGEPITLNITNNLQSSSIYEFGQHAVDYPWCKFVDKYEGSSETVQSIYNMYKIPNNFGNFLNIDIQGAELLALKGMANLLNYFEYLYLEINTAETYKNCALVNEIDEYVKKYHFFRVETKMASSCWGDAFYCKFLPSRRHFKKYYGDGVLVESGTYIGDGVREALRCGFKRIISYEVSPSIYNSTFGWFSTTPNVELYLKSSLNMGDEINSIGERITFWLDGHYSGGPTSYDKKKCPLLEELEIIKKHTRKDHIILIDDVRLMGTDEFSGITLEQIKKAILEINPLYKFFFENGEQDNDILVALV